jgi:methylamine dehydrogenase heavy chain
VKKIIACLGLWLVVSCPVHVWGGDFQPQRLTNKPAIDAGANVFSLDQEWGGSSSIQVFSATDLTYKGNMSGGTMAQMLLSADGKRAYVASVFMKRITYGEAEMVLQAFDVASLSPVKEVILPPKFAMLNPYESMLAQSADGQYVYVQNATPATSVTVVDIVAGKVTGEIPTPGCFGIYPSQQGHKFSVICGDGTFASYALNADGSAADRTPSKKIFDVDEDPIFLASQRAGADLIYISFHGNIYRVSDQGPAIELASKIPMTEGIHGDWAPGGFGVIAYSRQHDVLFISMHPHAKDGSHKEASKEIWAYKLAEHKLLHRSPVEGVRSLSVSDGPRPMLVGLKEKTLTRFEVEQPEFKLQKTHERANSGASNLEVALRP